VIKYIDEPLYKFLTELDEKGLLDDTLLVFMSDHGNHMHFVKAFTESQQFNTERMFPLFILNLPETFVTKYPELAWDIQMN
jgi:arylsulfatase A-like enzyme